MAGNTPALPSPLLFALRNVICEKCSIWNELINLAERCTSCGKKIPPKMVPRMKKVSGSHQPLCRRCVLDKAESGELRRLHCRDCNKDIEPNIVQRILRARKRGRIVPLICKDCFVKRRGGREAPLRTPVVSGDTRVEVRYVEREVTAQPEQLTSRAPEIIDLDVEEWECMTCAAPLEPDEVNEIRKNNVVRCEYCGCSISADQYR